MTFNGWAVELNGLMLTAHCESDQAAWDELECAPEEVIDALTAIPSGLDLPSLRTEDVTYYQRDGAKHFSDWYEPRIITIEGSLGPTDIECDDCSTVRQQLQNIVQAYKRTCCDTEMVIFPDCYTPDHTDGINAYPDGTFDVDADGWTGDNGATVARVTSPTHTGAGALEIEWDTDPVSYDDPAWSGEKAVGPVLAGAFQGQKYLISAWLFAEAGQPALVLGCSDTAGDDAVYTEPVEADDAWHYVSLDYEVPFNGEVMPFVVNGEATTAGDLGYVDDVQMELYVDIDRSLNGPFGVVGRPREFKYSWVNRKEQIVDFVARFDAVDQRMYVLDSCGTPGYTNCVDIDPGAQLFSVCFEDGSGDYIGEQVICLSSGGFCFSNPVTTDDSVDPTVVNVGGTEKVNPTITLIPPLIRPYVELTTTGEYVLLDETLNEGDSPVTINTEEGTAFDGDGNSLTHLLRGSLFLSMYPGNYEWRLLSAGVQDSFEDPGYATLCWRDTVVNA